MQKLNFLSAKEKKLIEMAKKIIKDCYKKNLVSIVSVLLTKKGNFYSGVNVKYKKIYKCICAERVALAKAIENKDYFFETIVSVKFEPKNNRFYVVNMCGECRQIFINHQPLKVIVDDQGVLKSVAIEKIFPYPYR